MVTASVVCNAKTACELCHCMLLSLTGLACLHISSWISNHNISYFPWIYASICGCRLERGAATRLGGEGLSRSGIRTARWRLSAYNLRRHGRAGSVVPTPSSGSLLYWTSITTYTSGFFWTYVLFLFHFLL